MENGKFCTLADYPSLAFDKVTVRDEVIAVCDFDVICYTYDQTLDEWNAQEQVELLHEYKSNFIFQANSMEKDLDSERVGGMLTLALPDEMEFSVCGDWQNCQAVYCPSPATFVEEMDDFHL